MGGSLYLGSWFIICAPSLLEAVLDPPQHSLKRAYIFLKRLLLVCRTIGNVNHVWKLPTGHPLHMTPELGYHPLPCWSRQCPAKPGTNWTQIQTQHRCNMGLQHGNANFSPSIQVAVDAFKGDGGWWHLGKL